MKYRSLFLLILATIQTTPIQSNKDLVPPASSNKMDLVRRAQILKLEIASENYQWLSQEISCGPCSITRNTIRNLLCVTATCLTAATCCTALAYTTDDDALWIPLVTPCTPVVGGLASEGCYSLDQSEKEQKLAKLNNAIKQKEKRA